MPKTFIEIGAGKGLGNAVAMKFAANGYHVVLVSRKEGNLKEYQKEFSSKGYDIDFVVADAADSEGFRKALLFLKDKYNDIEVIHYNVGVTCPDCNYQVDEKLMAERYQTDVLGAFQVMLTFANEEYAQKKAAILVTGGGFALYPTFSYLPLSMDKAALRAMVFAEYNEWKDKGLFIGTVTVTNAIGKAKGYECETIAEKFWELFERRDKAEIVY